MTENELLQTNDVMVWANEFIACMKKNNWTIENIDVGLMFRWFANAMCAQDNALIANTKLTPSEAVYLFVGWLTTRDDEVTFSGQHDAAIAADLADQFCNENGLEPPRW